MAEHLNFKRPGYNRKTYQAMRVAKGIPTSSSPLKNKPTESERRTDVLLASDQKFLDDANFMARPARQRHDIEKRMALAHGGEKVIEKLQEIEHSTRQTNPEFSRKAFNDAMMIVNSLAGRSGRKAA